MWVHSSEVVMRFESKPWNFAVILQIRRTAISSRARWVHPNTCPGGATTPPSLQLLPCNVEGFKVAAIEQSPSSIALHDWQPAPGESWAFVFGNEVRGVEGETIEQCDTTIEIPQFGAKQSLNVSVCGGILLWEAARKMQFPY